MPEEPKNCWEFWDCPEETKEKCSAYTAGVGKYCLFFTENFKPRVKRDFSSCIECQWYKKRFC
jgi:hypothetical protein